jgi:group I intron endonuclease
MKTNKELREEYKQKKFRMGVFQIRNTVNGKLFVGSSPNLEAIWNRHKSELKSGGHRNEKLQQEWRTFGEESFAFEVLSELAPQENEPANYQKELRQLEALFIDELQPFAERGYHTAKG